jgi:DNA-3-methyladenine glycosylase
MREPLARSFYERDPLEVAPELLGKVLVRSAPCPPAGPRAHGVGGDTSPAGAAVVRAGLIVEVEAYRGETDAASHAFRGRTARSATMFGPAGHLYVYFIYGVHNCANVVCWPEGTAGAVLLRALEPLEGSEEMRAARFGTAAGGRPVAGRPTDALCSGPGRLCQALAIDRSLDGADLVRGEQGIWVADGDGTTAPAHVRSGPRVGLGQRVGAVAIAQPWRYWIDGNKSVSGPRPRGRR